MAKIPDIGTSPRPTPSPSRGIVSPQTSGFDRAGAIFAQDAAQTGQGMGDIADSIGRINDQIMKSEARMQARQEAVDRVGIINSFRQELNDGLTGLEDAGTIADTRHVRSYSQEVDQKFQRAIENWGGSQEGLLALEEDLTKLRFEHSATVAAKSHAAGKARVMDYLGGTLNQGASQVIENPGMLSSALTQIDTEVKKLSPVMTPDEERDFRGRATSLLVKQSALGILRKNPTMQGLEQVSEMLMDPALFRLVDAQTQSAIADQMFATHQAIIKAQADALNSPLVEVGMPDGTNRYVTRAEAIGMPGPHPDAKSEPLVEVGRPDGTNIWVTREQAVGQPGPNRTPLVDMSTTQETSFLKEYGKNEAEQANNLQNVAIAAYRTKDDIQAMKSSLASGNFKTGFAGEARANIARALQLFGVDGSEISSIIGSAPTAEAMERASARIATALAQEGGRLTNMFLETIRTSLPGLSRTPEGNAILLEVMDRVADRQIQIGELVDKYVTEYGALTPRGQVSFLKQVGIMEKNDPVISAELRARIEETAAKAPKSWKDVPGIVMGNASAKSSGDSKVDAPTYEGWDFEKDDDQFYYYTRSSDGMKIKVPK